ncbi:MAG TPA: SpoIIE family protein phosphatase [Pyrinomonadaceae bacterium]|nr:SpoIIE family protein phosphatase [Pyrinomonadaceae bacterium]
MTPLRNTTAFVPQARNPQRPCAKNLRPPRTLIADDETDILTALRILLSNDGYELETVSSPAAVLEAIKRTQFDVVLMDLNYARDTTSGREGMDLITRIHALDPLLPIVVMTGWATVDLAVEAMRRGVRDFVQKPWDNSRLLQTLHKQVKHARARRNVQHRLALAQKTDARLQRELVEARELQENLLANSSTAIAGLDIATEWLPATTVGGDYIAAFNIDDEHAALCVADVVGKGLPAALLMANFQAALKSLAAQNLSPAELTTRLNDVLYANIPLHKFVTAFYAVVNVPNRTLAFSNAGHNPSLLMRNDGECVRLDAGGSVLGAFPNEPFAQEEIQLRPGDRLLLFTDGLTEACDDSGEQFGEQRLIDLLQTHRRHSAEELKELLLDSAAQFCDHNFRDDAALMVIAID